MKYSPEVALEMKELRLSGKKLWEVADRFRVDAETVRRWVQRIAKEMK